MSYILIFRLVGSGSQLSLSSCPSQPLYSTLNHLSGGVAKQRHVYELDNEPLVCDSVLLAYRRLAGGF